VDWQVQAWVRTDDFGPVRQASLRAIKIALDEAGISVPFPQMEILTRGRAASPQPLGDGVESRLPLPPAGWPQPTYQRPNPPENPQT
jgi:small-conductance mechanosensitive channel